MDRDTFEQVDRGTLWRVRSKFPLTVLGVVAVSWWLLGTEFASVFGTRPSLWNLPAHAATLVFHSDYGHFRGNAELLVLFGVVLTLLTSDRHVLGLVVTTQTLGSVLYVATAGGWAVGSSLALSAVFAAAMVRSVGVGMQNASADWLQTIVGGLLVPFSLLLFVVVVFSGPDDIAHLGHFYGFVFGGAIEAMYVFDAHEA